MGADLVVKREGRQCTSSTVAVDGRLPEARGVVWLPRTPGVGDGAAVGDAVGLGDAVSVGTVGVVEGDEVVADVGDGLAAASPAPGLRAIAPVDEATNTPAPSATRPRIATIGTKPIRVPTGNRSRQLGQNPDTGVATYPQFRQRTGRRFRAMAWLAAFSVRDPF